MLLHSTNDHDMHIAQWCFDNSARKLRYVAERYVFFKALMESHRRDEDWAGMLGLWDRLQNICWRVGERS